MTDGRAAGSGPGAPPLRRVAIFGNAGGGKSTLARRLAEITGLPLHVVDKMQWRDGDAAPIPHEDYLRAHAALVAQDAWIIDGYGTTETAWERFARADTLVHVDLPLPVHAWWVTKRLLSGLFVAPKGWPAGSPLWRSSLASYRVLLPCHRHMTPRYRTLIAESAKTKRSFALTSKRAMARFVQAIEREVAKAARSA